MTFIAASLLLRFRLTAWYRDYRLKHFYCSVQHTKQVTEHLLCFSTIASLHSCFKVCLMEIRVLCGGGCGCVGGCVCGVCVCVGGGVCVGVWGWVWGCVFNLFTLNH